MDWKNTRRNNDALLPGAGNVVGIFSAIRRHVVYRAQHGRENPPTGRSMNDEIKTGLDLAAVAGGVGSWLALLPDIAALLSIAWLALRIWETETVKRLTGRD